MVVDLGHCQPTPRMTSETYWIVYACHPHQGTNDHEAELSGIEVVPCPCDHSFLGIVDLSLVTNIVGWKPVTNLGDQTAMAMAMAVVNTNNCDAEVQMIEI